MRTLNGLSLPLTVVTGTALIPPLVRLRQRRSGGERERGEDGGRYDELHGLNPRTP